LKDSRLLVFRLSLRSLETTASSKAEMMKLCYYHNLSSLSLQMSWSEDERSFLRALIEEEGHSPRWSQVASAINEHFGTNRKGLLQQWLKMFTNPHATS
jgi:hypothetical protein